MTQNIIYYGPPGTGKTYYMQQKIEKYTDYTINNQDIIDAYTVKSEDWLLIALIILQNNNPLTSQEIIEKINALQIEYKGLPSVTLEEHSIENSKLASTIARKLPRIFLEVDDKWYVDRLKIIEFDKKFMEEYMKNAKLEKRYDFVTFHQSFVYEDFIEGIRPICDNSTQTIGYNIKDGIFKNICKKASDNPHKSYALFIDEINRGNISEIFGELISLIEIDKRKGQYCELETILPYSKTSFSVPSNLNIIGTMNSSDKSISIIDLALRRRFEFINIKCNYEVLEKTISLNGIDPRNIDGIDVVQLLKIINERIELLLDENHVIGHAYFIKAKSVENIKNIITKKIIPLLEEYFFDDLQKIQIVLNDLDENGNLIENSIYSHKELEPDKLLSFTGEYAFETKKIYYLNPEVNVDSIKKIYNGTSV